MDKVNVFLSTFATPIHISMQTPLRFYHQNHLADQQVIQHAFLCSELSLLFSLAAMIFSVPTSLHKKTLEINYEVQNWLCYVDSQKGYVSVANQRSVDKKRKTIVSIRKYCTIFFLYWPWIASTFYVSLMGKPATEATLCNTGSVL